MNKDEICKEIEIESFQLEKRRIAKMRTIIVSLSLFAVVLVYIVLSPSYEPTKTTSQETVEEGKRPATREKQLLHVLRVRRPAKRIGRQFMPLRQNTLLSWPSWNVNGMNSRPVNTIDLKADCIAIPITNWKSNAGLLSGPCITPRKRFGMWSGSNGRG